MTKNRILASVASLKVLESWGVKNIYGYPGGSISSLMNALQIEQNRIHYIQIRHEQVGALAASAHAKLTGKIGVAFGSAGPGAVNLLDGLYDAKYDHVPVLAIVGQVPSTNINYNFFQEIPEKPIFEDVASYNRVVMTPESMPHVFDEAIKAAYANKGVSVVVVPNDYGFKEIPNRSYTSVSATDDKKAPLPMVNDQEVKQFLTMVSHAKRPVIHFGRGIKNHGSQLVKLSENLQIPLIADGLAFNLISHKYRGFLGTFGRASSKAADEILATADLVIDIGGDFPFAHVFYASHPFKYIQIDTDRSKLGRHHHLDLGIWSDAGKFINRILEQSSTAHQSKFFQAAIADMDNWRNYLGQIEASSDDPILPSQVYYQINHHADNDAIYSIDVGDNIINTFRNLQLTTKNKWITSALFATMGFGLPGAMAGKIDYPDRQVWNITGDGAQSMVMQDLVTLAKYQLPVINVVTSNQTLSFIKGEQEDTPMQFFGVDIHDINFEMVAKGMGIDATTVHNIHELKPAFDKAVQVSKSGKSFLINVKIADQRALPVEDLKVTIRDRRVEESVKPVYRIDKVDKHYTVRELFDHYKGQSLKPVTEFFNQFNVKF
ncbi:pyruvate oxidase [Philodulcilactobacillus myokoensis]|uniref:Pyruvate oxidase n=1 Tax=Philodulcilactobacillus myokoensis TaxID=2929573 RepID=A0A9W6B2F1_9LACO|nr:pyruvate oxidase [Philodulcilactobacillus myokoensis]GLB47546.1 pyruvate oxidase [Philodulcilactobacillus myokoensis]